VEYQEQVEYAKYIYIYIYIKNINAFC
jgi:hypothetical protein